MSERLPTDRVFLIRFGSNAEPSAGIYCGRIEHVQTGRVSRFSSLGSAEEFISEVLSGVAGSDKALASSADPSKKLRSIKLSKK